MNYKLIFIILIFFWFLIPGFLFAETIIDAQVVRNQDGSGECLISSGFPLPPGLVTEKIVREGRVKVFVEGEEIAANISALRGRHQDGSLRSILIQFNYSLKKGEELPAKIVISENARSYPDPVYKRPTLEIITNNNVIFPVGAEYLVSTNIYFRNLLPVGAGRDFEEKFYTDLAENRFDHLSPDGSYGSTYEPVSAMIGLWARFGGDVKFWNQALATSLRNTFLNYNTPDPDPDRDPRACRADAVANPDARDPGHNNCGVGTNERYAARFFGYAQMYLLTGYRDFWGIIAHTVQAQQRANSNLEEAIDRVISSGKWDRPRYNYANNLSALIPAYMIDSTIPVMGEWFSGREMDFKDQFEWSVEAIIYHQWDLKWIKFDNGSGTVPKFETIISQDGASAELLRLYSPTKSHPYTEDDMPEEGFIQIRGSSLDGGSFDSGPLSGISANAMGPEEDDYREGIVGTRSYSPRSSSDEGYAEDHNIFQYSFIANFLIDYYLYVHNDDRIPDLVKNIVDIMLSVTRKLEEGDTYYEKGSGYYGQAEYTYPRMLRAYPEYKKSGNDPWTLGMYARSIAFLLKTVGDHEVNGTFYSEWYERYLNTGQVNPKGVLIWQWRHFGQFYGWNQDAPWMMEQESLVGYGPSEMREPVQYDSIPGDKPDIGREGKLGAPDHLRIKVLP